MTQESYNYSPSPADRWPFGYEGDQKTVLRALLVDRLGLDYLVGQPDDLVDGHLGHPSLAIAVATAMRANMPEHTIDPHAVLTDSDTDIL